MSKLNTEKHYYVPWEGYTKGSEPPHRGPLDRLCLQGPHTLERAVQVAAEIRAAGAMASVIDCSETFTAYEDEIAGLKRALRDLAAKALAAKTDHGTCFRDDGGLLEVAILKAQELGKVGT